MNGKEKSGPKDFLSMKKNFQGHPRSCIPTLIPSGGVRITKWGLVISMRIPGAPGKSLLVPDVFTLRIFFQWYNFELLSTKNIQMQRVSA